MNLWLRLIAYLVSVRWRGAIKLPFGVSMVRFRCLPSDLDTSLHMNNGRYLTLMDLGRLDFMVAGGLWRPILRHRWTPIASAIKIRFRREVRLFDKVRLETRLVAWNTTLVIMEQVFVIEGGRNDGQIAAHALFKGGLYDRTKRAFVPVQTLMDEMGISSSSPPLTSEVEAFLKADDELKRAGAERI